jgi:Family of unknown function (DUF6807)
MLRSLYAALVYMIALAAPIGAQQRTIEVEITHTYDGHATICVPLSIPEQYAKQREVIVEDPNGGPKSMLLGQLTAPGLMTDHIPPSAKGMVRRDLHCQYVGLRAKTGDVTKLKVLLDAKNRFAGYGFDWNGQEGQFAELALNYGKMPVLRYLHPAYDNSSKEKREQTAKVLHKLYEFRSSKGGINPILPQHELVYAYNKVTFGDGKECDLWNCTPGDARQEHAEFQVKEAARVVGRQCALIHWCGPKGEVFAKEEREVTAYNLGPRGALVDFASRLKTTGGLVKLRGEPGLAGLQFRADKAVAEKTYYWRPDGKGAQGETRSWDPKTGKGPVNLAWDACSFVMDGRRATVLFMNHPGNPGESRWNESDSGRFGCFGEYDVTDKKPLVLNYRFFVKPGASSPSKIEFEMKAEEIEKLNTEFSKPPKVKVIEPGK